MSFDNQSCSCVKACYYHLWRIRQIRKYVDNEVVTSLVHTFVTSCLDYCNSLYANSSVSTRQRLQHVQNCRRSSCWCTTSRVISSTAPSCWSLDNVQTVYFNRVLNGTVPQYLAELCQVCSDDRLRSALRQDCIVPRTYKRLADSSFSVVGPTAWNSLPAELRCTSTYSSFCSHLKTFLLVLFPVALHFTHYIFR